MNPSDPLPELIPRRWLTVGAVLFVAGLAVNCASLNVERGLYEGLQSQQRLKAAPLPPEAPTARSDYERYQRERARLQGDGQMGGLAAGQPGDALQERPQPAAAGTAASAASAVPIRAPAAAAPR